MYLLHIEMNNKRFKLKLNQQQYQIVDNIQFKQAKNKITQVQVQD